MAGNNTVEQGSANPTLQAIACPQHHVKIYDVGLGLKSLETPDVEGDICLHCVARKLSSGGVLLESEADIS